MADLRKLLRVDEELDERSSKMLVKAIAQNNQDGFDFLEFLASVDKLKAIPMDEATAYKSAFTTASTFGITKEKLVQSAHFYIGVLRKEYANFRQALENQVAKKIKQPESKILELQKDNERIDREIEKLKKRQKVQQEKIQSLAGQVVESRQKLEEGEKVFNHTFETLKTRIEEDIEKIESQL